jgi:hypothetical protein
VKLKFAGHLTILHSGRQTETFPVTIDAPRRDQPQSGTDTEIGPEVLAMLRRRVAACYYDEPRVVDVLARAIVRDCVHL